MNNIAAITYKNTFFGGLCIQDDLGGVGLFGHGVPPSRQGTVKGSRSIHLLFTLLK